ncbi:uncharacterized protein ACR2FA_006099 [Aphomia sociella]
MSKCNKVKNPCKICLGPVSQKNGLQCHGACESWVHYRCLNYTPGKIKDIKAGIIKVTCPCPDCKTSQPKEYRTDEAYSCTNIECPANKPPHCDNTKCPLNVGAPDKMNQTSGIPACPLHQCGNSCKQYSSPQVPHVPKPPLGGPCALNSMPITSSSDACITGKKCPSGCNSYSDIPGDARRKVKPNISHMDIPTMSAVERMCNTVGQLTDQINDLMMNLKQAVGREGEVACTHKQCQQKGSKTLCPKPCYCPGNPAKGRRR